MEFPSADADAIEEAEYSKPYYLSLKLLGHHPFDCWPCPFLCHAECEKAAHEKEQRHPKHGHHIIDSLERSIRDGHLKVGIGHMAEDY